MIRSQSDSFLVIENQFRNRHRRKLLSRIFSILQLDRCFSLYRSRCAMTCGHYVSTDPRSRSGGGSTDGREMDKPGSPRSPGLHQHRHLEPPKTILDVDYKLLQSGIAILPGKILTLYIPVPSTLIYMTAFKTFFTRCLHLQLTVGPKFISSYLP